MRANLPFEVIPTTSSAAAGGEGEGGGFVLPPTSTKEALSSATALFTMTTVTTTTSSTTEEEEDEDDHHDEPHQLQQQQQQQRQQVQVHEVEEEDKEEEEKEEVLQVSPKQQGEGSSSSSRSLLQRQRLRHDEQENEDYYDERDEANDDINKGKIKFSTKKLYGRDNELETLHVLYQRMMTSKTTSSSSSTSSKRRQNEAKGSRPPPLTTRKSKEDKKQQDRKSIVFLPGFSGTGKSSLIKEFIKQLTATPPPSASADDKMAEMTSEEEGTDDEAEVKTYPQAAATTRHAFYPHELTPKPRFISGKYDELLFGSSSCSNIGGTTAGTTGSGAGAGGSSSMSTSYSAIAKAIGSYLSNLYHSNDDNDMIELELLKYELHMKNDGLLGQYVSVLQEIIPEITYLIDIETNNNVGISLSTSTDDDESSILLPIDVSFMSDQGDKNNNGGGGNNDDSINIKDDHNTKKKNVSPTSPTRNTDMSATTMATSTGRLAGASNSYSNIADARKRQKRERRRRLKRSRQHSTGGGIGSSSSRGGSVSRNTQQSGGNKKMQLQMVKHVFRNLIKLLCNAERPLILFLDDLQWIDEGSLELLTSLLNDPQLQYFMFIGAYRSNEVPENIHPVSLLIRDLQNKYNATTPTTTPTSEEEDVDGNGPDGDQDNGGTSTNNSVVVLELMELSQEHINEFIQDTLSFETGDESWPLTKAIYPKTLGNIFFTMQALEELVRISFLYYDVMFFTWSYNQNLTHVEMNSLLSDDVVEMVKSKIRHTLPYYLQRTLSIFAFTRSTIDANTLYELMKATSTVQDSTENDTVGKLMKSSPSSLQDLIQGLDLAVKEGLLMLLSTGVDIDDSDSDDDGAGHVNRMYAFSHDRIQEAAQGLIQDETYRNEICYHIAGALEYRSETDDGEEWMLFTAVYHMNALPSKYFSESSTADHDGDASLYLATINSKAATFAINRSAFSQAVQLLRAGVKNLNDIARRGVDANPVLTEASPNADTVATGTANASVDASQLWNEHYDLCISLYNCLIETEFTLGNMGNARDAVQRVLTYASRHPKDKIIAQFHDVEIYTSNKDRDFAGACVKSIRYLVRDHGIMELPDKSGTAETDADATSSPSTDTTPPQQAVVTDKQLAQEKKALNAAKRKHGRLHGLIGSHPCSNGATNLSLIDLMELDEMDDYHSLVMKLIAQLSHASMVSGNTNLCLLVNLIAQKLSWMHGLNEYLPTMLPHYGSQLRKLGQFRQAADVAIAAEELLYKMCHDGGSGNGQNIRPASFVRGVHVCRGAVTGMKVAFASNISTCNEVYKTALGCGETQFGILAAMVYSLSYYCCGGPLNTLLESKLIQFQNEATSNGLSPTLIVTFQIFRQTLYNLQGKKHDETGHGSNSSILMTLNSEADDGAKIRNPTMFDNGIAMDEDQALSEFQQGSPTYKQTLRDISVFRLLLGVIFRDKACMIDMLQRLSNCPDFDLCVPRQHLRDVMMGLASFYLVTSLKKQLKQLQQCKGNEENLEAIEDTKQQIQKYQIMGKSKLSFFSTLKKKVKSENATPIVSVLKAVQTPSPRLYEKAIDACQRAELPHLTALTNEWYGIHLLEKSTGLDSNMSKAQSRMIESMWLYYDWGAMSKVKQMRETYTFLRRVQRKEKNQSFTAANLMRFSTLVNTNTGSSHGGTNMSHGGSAASISGDNASLGSSEFLMFK